MMKCVLGARRVPSVPRGRITHHPTDIPRRRPRPHLRGTVAYLLEQRHADYVLSAKGGQAAPLAWVHAALPPAVPEAEEHV
jgi:hypothetical protein